MDDEICSSYLYFQTMSASENVPSYLLDAFTGPDHGEDQFYQPEIQQKILAFLADVL